MAQQIGTVTHYYGKPRAAVVDLTAPLAVGETITVDLGTTHFTQVANSMQINHQPVERAEGGDSIGLEVTQAVKSGAAVYRGAVPE